MQRDFYEVHLGSFDRGKKVITSRIICLLDSGAREIMDDHTSGEPTHFADIQIIGRQAAINALNGIHWGSLQVKQELGLTGNTCQDELCKCHT